MDRVTFVFGFASLVAVGLVLAERFLPQERWQVLASIPTRKCSHSGRWTATNFTFYGLLTALAGLAALALFLVLSRSIDLPYAQLGALVGCTLLIALPASAVVAAKVERKPHTLSIAGATFPTLLLVPLGIIAYNQWFAGPGADLPALPTLAALMTAYVIGEGLGRVACLSFGCCYGRPIDSVSPMLRPLFERWHLVFRGSTKKIAYAGGLEGVKVVPIQAMTSWVHLVGGAAATYLFLGGDFRASFLVAAVVGLGWRMISEFLRNDHRGKGTWISPYQKMAFVGLFYCVGLSYVLAGPEPPAPDLAAGIDGLWRPGVILMLQAVGITLFVHSGWSKVTGCQMDIHIHTDRV